MPRLRIIILEREATSNTFQYVLWADVPTARQPYYAKPGAVSAWKDALPADNTALEDGTVVEHSATQRINPASSMAQVQAQLENRWADYQNEINTANPWRYFGSTWDGAAWIVTNNG